MKTDLFQPCGHCWVSKFAGILSTLLSQHHWLDLLTHFYRQEHRRSDGMLSQDKLEKDSGFSLQCSLSLPITHPGGASCHAVRCPCGEVPMAKMYVSCQQPVRMWDLPTAMWVSLDMLAAPSPNLDCSLGRDPESEAPSLAASRLLTHRTCEIINFCCFKPTECGGNLLSSPE